MNNYQDKLNDLFSKLNNGATKQELSNFLNSKQGREIASKLSGVDKDKVINAFMNMNQNQLKEKLNNTDFSKITQSDIARAINKLK